MVYSATQFAKKLDISRSYLYYLKDNIEINLETSHNGKIIWNDKNFQQILDYIQKNKPKKIVEAEIRQPYKSIKINNRRYLRSEEHTSELQSRI